MLIDSTVTFTMCRVLELGFRADRVRQLSYRALLLVMEDGGDISVTRQRDRMKFGKANKG